MATPLSPEQIAQAHRAPTEVELPAPTAWPIVLAFGFTLLFAGLLTSASVSVLGAVLTVAGCVGWFRDVFPHEREETVSVVADDFRATTMRLGVDRFPVAPDLVRAYLPVETYPVSAGLKGGLAGGIAMAVVACAYGLISQGSIWYPINLLAAVVYSRQEARVLTPEFLNAFHPGLLFIAVLLHLTGSTLVGLLYGAMLPMFARRPTLLGGLVAPVLWSGLLYSTMDLLNPVLGSHIHWGWFIASQVAFGVVAGLVVVRQLRVRTRENLPFALRAGIEAQGIMPLREGGDKRP
jgi:hypothetical protein